MTTTGPTSRVEPGGDRLQQLGLPVLLALVQVGGTFGAASDQPDRKAVDLVAVVLLLAGPAALVVLRRRPVALAVTAMAVTVGYVAAGYPYGPVFLSLAVALYRLVGSGRRVEGWLVAGGGLLAAVALQATIGYGPAWTAAHAAGVAGWLVVVLAVADIGRIRRERVAEAQRARDEADRRRASEERLRIAQELHDVLAHNISLINVQAGVGLHLMDGEPERAREALSAIKGASKDALGELRAVLDLLRGDDAAPRTPTAGLDQLERLVANAAAAGLEVRIDTDGDARPLSPEVDLAALRITQEALTNVARHARATRARVHLRYDTDELLVEVDDDGQGASADDPASPAGKGIVGMRERAVALGGRLEAGPNPAGGFRVTARLPISAP